MNRGALATISAVLLVVVVGVALLYSVRTQTVLVTQSASPISTVLLPVSSGSAPHAVASASSGLVTYEDLYLGYRISLPATYRPSASVVVNRADLIRRDSFTLLSPEEERAACAQRRGEIPSAASGLYLYVNVSPNPERMTAVEWVNGPRSLSHFQTVVPPTFDGREAVKLVAVATGETTAYVIRENDRMYHLTPTLWPNPQRLDDIAPSFKVLAPQVSPAPTPRPTASPTCP